MDTGDVAQDCKTTNGSFLNHKHVERYIEGLQKDYLSYVNSRITTYATAGSLTADLRSRQRTPFASERELELPIEFVRDLPQAKQVKFAFRNHSHPGRSFWQAFAHSHPKFGHENAWPVVTRETYAFLSDVHNGFDHHRDRLYSAFAQNMTQLPVVDPEGDPAMSESNTMLHRSCIEDIPTSIFMAQVVADL